MKKEKKLNILNDSFKSILIILSYFLLPYVINSITKSQVINGIIYLVYAVLLIVLYKDTFKKDFKDMKENKKDYIKKILLNTLLLIIVMAITNAIINALFNINGTSENDYSLLNMFEKSPVVLILLTCIYYPIVEGIVFRKAIRDVIDKKWLFIVFSSLFYFFFNIVYTSMSFNNIMASVCYFFSMMILSNYYWKTNNFTSSVIILILYNIFVSILSFV